MKKNVCMAKKSGQVKRSGKARVGWRDEDGTPHYYCYGYIDLSTEELLNVCKECRNNVIFVQEDLGNCIKAKKLEFNEVEESTTEIEKVIKEIETAIYPQDFSAQTMWLHRKNDIILQALNDKLERENLQPLTLEELKVRNGKPIWIQMLDRPDLSRWHFVVKTKALGIIAKDGLGKFECYPHTEDEICFNGCYFDIEHGNKYGETWLAYDYEPICKSRK